MNGSLRASYADHHFTEQAALFDPALAPTDSPGSRLDQAALVRIAQSTDAPLQQRLAAGQLLAVVGDPRLKDLPAVIEIPGGRAPIGTPEQDVDRIVAQWRHVGVEASWIAKECPAHVKEIASFRLAPYLVTNRQWLLFLRANPGMHRPSTWYLGAYPWDRSNHPVCGITAHQADAYVTWLTATTGCRYQLPTEAQWEYAARGIEGREYPWGSRFRPDVANTRELGVHTTTPVGIFPGGRSPFGLWDMGGNVEEFVLTDYQPYPGGEFIADHLVDSLGSYRITRGGSFTRYGDLTRAARRHGAFPSPLYPVGLRVAADSVSASVESKGERP